MYRTATTEVWACRIPESSNSTRWINAVHARLHARRGSPSPRACICFLAHGYQKFQGFREPVQPQLSVWIFLAFQVTTSGLSWGPHLWCACLLSCFLLASVMSNTETEVTSQDFVMEDRQYPACSKYHFRKLSGDRGMRVIYKFSYSLCLFPMIIMSHVSNLTLHYKDLLRTWPK